MPHNRYIVLLLLLAALLPSACHYPSPAVDLAWDCTPEQRDSIEFAYHHHYTIDYNFEVTADSLRLLPESPADIMTSLSDTSVVYRRDIVVVADMVTVPTDTTDTTWIKLARDQSTLGWVSEKEMLSSVVPDDPISRFIHVMGNRRNIALFAVAIIAVGVLLLRKIRRRKTRIVHFNDIDSVYPTALCIDVAFMAVIYSSVQHFVPETWQEFYFHPTLNPFVTPPIISLLIVTFWGMIILTLASIDDVGHKMGWGDALPYLCSLLGMMMVVYLVLAATTFIYVGYPLLVTYVIFAFVKYRGNRLYKYVCGRCGHKLRHKGRCPFCGAENI